MAKSQAQAGTAKYSFAMARTSHGHLVTEASSAMQKSIRRCMVDDAIYWALQIARADFGPYVWKRLRIMVSEDIGLANPGLAAQIFALQNFWESQRKEEFNKGQADIFLVHAVMEMANSPKSRACDNANICFGADFIDNERRPMPDYAVDKHTARGKRSSPPRGIIHFKHEGSKITNEKKFPGISERYQVKAEKYMTDVWAVRGGQQWQPGDGDAAPDTQQKSLFESMPPDAGFTPEPGKPTDNAPSEDVPF